MTDSRGLHARGHPANAIAAQTRVTTMNARFKLAFPNAIRAFAAALAVAVTAGILWSVVGLFQSRGAPMETLAAAERACAQHAYHSEREACIKRWVAEVRAVRVASQ